MKTLTTSVLRAAACAATLCLGIVGVAPQASAQNAEMSHAESTHNGENVLIRRIMEPGWFALECQNAGRIDGVQNYGDMGVMIHCKRPLDLAVPGPWFEVNYGGMAVGQQGPIMSLKITGYIQAYCKAGMHLKEMARQPDAYYGKCVLN